MSQFKVEVRRVGNYCFPRFLLADQSGRYWTGTNWTNEAEQAVLFARHEDAQSFCNEMRANGTRACFTSVTVRIDHQIICTLEDLRDYLKRNARLTVGDDGGEHPCDGTCIDLVIDWDGLETKD